MFARFAAATTALCLFTRALAAPALTPRADPAVLSTTAVDAIVQPWGIYAAAGYCAPEKTLTWSCGALCSQTSGFRPVASGGDGAVKQFWYVGYDSTYQTVVVGHQGSEFEYILPVITDINLALTPLNNALFPGLGAESGILVHTGFNLAQALVAREVLSAVKLAMSRYSATTVTTVGHSLGGSIALLQAVYLSLQLPTGTKFKTYTFGQPRVGNQAFADYIDSQSSRLQLTRTTNKRDVVPILPGRFLGYRHAQGEVHIDDPSGQWYACPGQDNESVLCTVGDVSSLLQLNTTNHRGPYGTVIMGSDACV